MNRKSSNPKIWSKKPVSRGILLGIIIFASSLAKSLDNRTATGKSSYPQTKVEEYLFFKSIPDGKCQTLSDGGKLRILFSRHPSKPINFRLTRFFAGKKQGMSKGTIYSNSTGHKLGCSIVDGREQIWVIERAVLVNSLKIEVEKTYPTD